MLVTRQWPLKAVDAQWIGATHLPCLCIKIRQLAVLGLDLAGGKPRGV
jgi:hypothetical protein